MSLIFDNIYEVVRQIPKGEVASYGQIAAILEAPRSARVVGWAMQQAPDDVPAHRVLKKDGSLNDHLVFNHLYSQKELLKEEGVQFQEDGRVNMKGHSWMGPIV
ncbi:MGMT family protein [Shouchella sp. JSM 1781072]|uniref:MGMT family protein n=1 Tax=Bacillaceae TaxID=186817 RepID=UPI000C06C3BC|nr:MULTISPECIES: MGMT family protein [Bacillaceae]UTR08030.1 MGMT family protein [Alkalihalobacillus sp. LMS6]